MKHPLNYLLLSICILHISGCGLVYSLDPSLDPRLEQRVDTWVKNHEYAEAIGALNRMGKSHAQYELLQRKKVEVQKAAKKYQAMQLRIIQTHIDKQEWRSAEQSLEQSMAKLPESPELETAYQDFIKKRAFYLNNLYYQLAINKAKWLVNDSDIQDELSRAIPQDSAARRASSEHREQAGKVYQQLNTCGTEAMNMGDLELAEECLLLAEALQPNETLRATITDIQQQLAAQRKRDPTVLSKSGIALLKNAKQKMQAGNLKEAVIAYKKISAEDKKYASVIAFRQELDTRVKNNVLQGIELGRKLYSQGEVKQALAVWNNIRELDPNNQHLINYIKRAERVLKKLQKLQKEGTTIKPPESKDVKS